MQSPLQQMSMEFTSNFWTSMSGQLQLLTDVQKGVDNHTRTGSLTDAALQTLQTNIECLSDRLFALSPLYSDMSLLSKQTQGHMEMLAEAVPQFVGDLHDQVAQTAADLQALREHLLSRAPAAQVPPVQIAGGQVSAAQVPCATPPGGWQQFAMVPANPWAGHAAPSPAPGGWQCAQPAPWFHPLAQPAPLPQTFAQLATWSQQLAMPAPWSPHLALPAPQVPRPLVLGPLYTVSRHGTVGPWQVDYIQLVEQRLTFHNLWPLPDRHSWHTVLSFPSAPATDAGLTSEIAAMLEAGYSHKYSEDALVNPDFTRLRPQFRHPEDPALKLFAPPLVEERWHTPSASQAKFCVACGKWMDDAHATSATHLEYLQYYIDTSDGWRHFSRDFLRPTPGSSNAKAFSSPGRLQGR